MGRSTSPIMLDFGDEYMWEPPGVMLQNCPLVTFNSKRGAQLLPCWVWR